MPQHPAAIGATQSAITLPLLAPRDPQLSVKSACPFGNFYNVFLGSQRIGCVERSNQPAGLVLWRDLEGPQRLEHADGTVEQLGDQTMIDLCREEVLQEAARAEVHRYLCSKMGVNEPEHGRMTSLLQWLFVTRSEVAP